MPIDPVILLVEELRSAELLVHTAAKEYERGGRREDRGDVSFLLSAIENLNDVLVETIPTSALGAAELIRLVVECLPASHARYTGQLSEIARRLSAGRRVHGDLISLRAIHVTLTSTADGASDFKEAPLLHSAILGASRPIVVFRAVSPMGAVQHNDAIERRPRLR